LGALIVFASPVFGAVRNFNELPVRRVDRSIQRSEGALSLYNTHTEERLEVTYRDSSGNYDSDAIKEMNYFLRCHYTQKVVPMDIRVIEFLNLVHKKAGGTRDIEVISGYRSPEYNNLLIREGRGAAKHSLHLLGKAIDFRIPGVGLDRLRQTAMNLEYGGVGYYPESGFIHLDSGQVRSW
jgi:uncharacterized protein YcbK (DUF882 family)